jgi:hypothetical protein
VPLCGPVADFTTTLKARMCRKKNRIAMNAETILSLAYERVLDKTGLRKEIEAERQRETMVQRLKEQDERKAANAKQIADAKRSARINVRSGKPFAATPKTINDTRALQAWLGHRNIQHTVRYTELSPNRFRDFWR